MIETISRFFDFLDRRQVFRRLAFIVVLVGTIRITDWALLFAEKWLSSPKSGMDVGAVIAAVTAPFTALQVAVIKFYMDSRETK